jgi:hypothetical protein
LVVRKGFDSSRFYKGFGLALLRFVTKVLCIFLHCVCWRQQVLLLLRQQPACDHAGCPC